MHLYECVRRPAGRLGIGALAMAVLIAGCSSADPSEPVPTVPLRMAHLDPQLGTLDLLVEGKTVLSGVGLGELTLPVEVPGGIRRLMVRNGQLVVTEFETPLSGTGINTLVVAGGGTGTVVAAMVDTLPTPDDHRPRLRLANIAMTGEPRFVEARLQRIPGDSVQHFGFDTHASTLGPLMVVNPGTYTIQVAVLNHPEVVLAETQFGAANDQILAIFFSREPNGGAFRLDVRPEE